MKTISLWQPWATLIALGVKTIETRSWACRYRGEMLIHAAKAWNDDCRRAFAGPGLIADVLAYHGITRPEDLPRGCIVARCRLDAIHRVVDALRPGVLERACGDFSPGRFGWVLTDIEAIGPIPCKGAQGLFEVSDELIGRALSHEPHAIAG